MHEVKIEIVGLEIFQGCIEGLLDLIDSVAIVPELCGDEDLRARNATLLDRSTNGGLGTVTIHVLKL